jgi:hypothetical protein
VLQKNWQDLIKPEKLVTEAGVDAGASRPSSPSRSSAASA